MFEQPVIDYHALAPEIVLTVALVVVLVADLLFDERNKWATSTLAGLGIVAAMAPVATLFLTGDSPDRYLFGGAYVVDDFSLVMKGLLLAAGFIVVLLSTDYIGEGDYYEGEYYFLLLSSLLGMVVMASSRDLISIFIALELLSIPAYMLAGWRKRDLKGNEASLKYYLMGVFASAVMLYGMSLIYGVTGTTLLTDIGKVVNGSIDSEPAVTLGLVFLLVGFAFKVSAVPFHTWAPDTYEGAPTPITAFLSVASKAAGFIAILSIIYVGFFGRADVYQPMFWVLAALTMTVGNLIAIRQTNIVRLLAYSSVAQAGFMLAPLAAVGGGSGSAGDALEAVVTYLLVYAAMNLGAFAVVITVARKTRSGEISSFGGLFEYAPGLTVLMTVFLFALAGIPPLAGWYAKFVVFRSLLSDPTVWTSTLAVIVGVNSVIALFYYANVARQMWMSPVPDEDRTPVSTTPSLWLSLAACATATIVLGVLPGIVGRLANLTDLPLALGG